MALISIITVVKDDFDGLTLTQKSLDAQRHTDFEWVVVNGGNSVRPCLWKQGRWPTLLIEEPDHGCYDAMNKGVRAAQSPYVLFLNAGDAFYSPHSLKALLDALAASPDADFIVGNNANLSTEGIISHRFLKGSFYHAARELAEGRFDPLFFHATPNHQSTLIRKALLEEIPYRLDVPISADTYQMFEAVARGYDKIVQIPDFIALFALGGMSSRRRLTTFLDLLRMLKTFSKNPKGAKAFMKAGVIVEMTRQSKYKIKLNEFLKMFLEYPLEAFKTWGWVRCQTLNEKAVLNALRAPTTILVINLSDRITFDLSFTYLQSLTNLRNFAFIGTPQGVKAIKASTIMDVPVDDLDEFLSRNGKLDAKTAVLVVHRDNHLPKAFLHALRNLGIKHFFHATGDKIVLKSNPPQRIIGVTADNKQVFAN